MQLRAAVHPRPRRGAAAVEFALILALILVPVLFGCWEVGCMVDAQQLLQNAAREGARRAASGSMTSAQVRQVVLDYLRNGGIPVANAVVTVENLTTASGEVKDAEQLDRLRITVTVPINDFQWIGVQGVTGHTHLTGRAEWFSLKDREFPSLGDPSPE